MKDSNFTGNSNTDANELKVLLWDIDGTLLHSTIQGGYKKYFTRTMERVFGFPGDLDSFAPSGMTDTQIMSQALAADGVSPDEVLARVDDLQAVFQEEMRKVVEANEEPYELLPGARDAVEAASRDPRFVNALLTGNLPVAAEIKLASVGLWDYFKNGPNAFGDISYRRADLAHAAGRIYAERFGVAIEPSRFVVIGDTPNDIACARDFGAKVVIVATGRNQSREKLLAGKPEAFLEDLQDTAGLIRLLGEM